MSPKEIRKYLKERDAALRTLNIEWFLKNAPNVRSRGTALAALHKMRYECTSIEPELRHRSGEWLRVHGYTRMFGVALLPEGELPE